MSIATVRAKHEINGNGIPEWLARFGVQKGEWLSLTKAQLRSQMRPDRPLKVQVWACGILHTAGYKGEIATTKRNNEIVPLTAVDIANELHRAAKDHYVVAGVKDEGGLFARLRHTKQDIRRALADLESDGLCERQTPNRVPLSQLSATELQRLPSGSTRILFWLTPKPPDPEMVREQWEEQKFDLEFSGDGEDKGGDDSDDDAGTLDSTPNTSKVEVGNKCLPVVSIQLILFDQFCNNSRKSKLAAALGGESALQDVIAKATSAAIRTYVEVVNSSLPAECLPEVGLSLPPEVAAERPPYIRSERHVERHVEREAAAASSVEGTQAHTAAAVSFVINRCAELGLQLPDEARAKQLLDRFPALPPAKWPKFADQHSPGLWLQKTPEQMEAEYFRQQTTKKPTSLAEAAKRVIERAKTKGAGS